MSNHHWYLGLEWPKAELRCEKQQIATYLKTIENARNPMALESKGKLLNILYIPFSRFHRGELTWVISSLPLPK